MNDSVPPANAPRRLPWTWLEWAVLAQTLLPALMFIPGLVAVRSFTKIGSYAVMLLAWWLVAAKPRSASQAEAGRSFAPRPWLAAALAWMALSILHPTTNSIVGGIAAVIMALSISSPAFWSGDALIAPRQITRLMLVIFWCNAAGSALGLLQVAAPDTFNPPVIPALEMGENNRDIYTYKTEDGREVIRPCGLTDIPGAAGQAGSLTAMLGLCLALRPGAWWKRAGYLGLSLIGGAVIYATQVRTSLVVQAICVAALVGILAWQGEWRKAGLIFGGGILVAGLGLFWAAGSIGNVVVQRFATLIESDPGDLYYAQSARGLMLQQAFDTLIWDYPLGAGLSRWGQIHDQFGDKQAGPDTDMIWAEIQINAWILDGGIPLLLLMSTAIGLAMRDTLRAAGSKDRDVASWAAVVLALNLSVVALCFSFTPFSAPGGVQFWMLAAVVHAAARQVRPKATATPSVP